MARARKKVVAKDYDSLIKVSQEKIEKLTTDLKEEKANLKALLKAKNLYEFQLAEEKKQEEMEKLTEMIEKSGKSFEEIKSFLAAPSK